MIEEEIKKIIYKKWLYLKRKCLKENIFIDPFWKNDFDIFYKYIILLRNRQYDFLKISVKMMIKRHSSSLGYIKGNIVLHTEQILPSIFYNKRLKLNSYNLSLEDTSIQTNLSKRYVQQILKKADKNKDELINCMDLLNTKYNLKVKYGRNFKTLEEISIISGLSLSYLKKLYYKNKKLGTTDWKKILYKVRENKILYNGKRYTRYELTNHLNISYDKIQKCLRKNKELLIDDNYDWKNIINKILYKKK